MFFASFPIIYVYIKEAKPEELTQVIPSVQLPQALHGVFTLQRTIFHSPFLRRRQTSLRNSAYPAMRSCKKARFAGFLQWCVTTTKMIFLARTAQEKHRKNLRFATCRPQVWWNRRDSNRRFAPDGSSTPALPWYPPRRSSLKMRRWRIFPRSDPLGFESLHTQKKSGKKVHSLSPCFCVRTSLWRFISDRHN